MSDEAPARALTIRVGDEVFSDVQDFIVLIRDKENGIISKTSSQCWAHGAMEKIITEIQHNNHDQAQGEEE